MCRSHNPHIEILEQAEERDQMSNLLPMDYRLLVYLADHGSAVPFAGIPAKLFDGEIPEGALNLVDLGMIRHHGDIVVLTDAGRMALRQAEEN
jgi:ribulose-5-phosphate 4-epimerase/fuculose-1-phosphate aldolase